MHTLNIERSTELVFRVVERRGSICCAIDGRGAVELALTNPRREIAGWAYKLAFEWTVR